MKDTNFEKDSNNIADIKCPMCGSTNIIYNVIQLLVGPPYHPICKDCSHTWVHSTKISFEQPQKLKLNIFQRIIERIF